ncbi:MAG: amidohydrolase family protein [Gemmatimonadales bacterium]|nr:amidohydrolase family protein [Gemmatimonadales bacterium]NIN50153.1 amidohydrolase family protein [Gemmatimonadales bacterium]NIP07617.1 amidohydrolase family protein [Gemmatimonadales bacterium]NIR01769.1 amidohydrolase family protein [Gemmatimonadales bacterium]NIS65672.1 amidohydrolase family protein [Gemmatimonadales bacterium]
MRQLRTLVAASILAAGPFAAIEAQWKVQIEAGAVPVPRGDLFIENLDAVWTANDTVYRNVSILIEDGVIRAIGPDLTAPAGVTVVEGTGHTAIPGLVDEHSHIAARSINECTGPVVPEVRVIDALDPEAYGIYRALSGGVTVAHVLHGSCNPIGGQSAIIKLRWGTDDPLGLLVQGAPQTVKFALGENVTRKNFGSEGLQRFPASREGVEAVYVQAFTAAQEYKKAWDDYRRNRRAYRVPPRRDLRLEALVEIMEGRILVTAHSYRSDEILMLMRVAERFGFKINTFTHVLEGYKVADEMAAHGAAGSTFSDWWMYKLEAYDAIPYNPSIMHQHGVKTSLNSDSQLLQTFFLYEFNKPVKYGGVSREDALRMLTRNPAEILHIDDKVGTIEVGKQADIALLSGDPFDVYTKVMKTIIDGIVYYDTEREAELRGEPVRTFPLVEVVPEVTTPTTTGSADLFSRATDAMADATAVQVSVTALVGATVHPVSRPPISNGIVLIEGGRIAAVGPASAVQVPAGATVVNLAGKHLYPGLVNPITQLGMVEIGQVAASRDDREVGRYNPHIRALTGVHPHSEAIPVARANGITTALTAPASGIIQGMGSVIQLKGDTPERMAVADRVALVINFPRPKGEAWDEPKLEGGRLEELVQLFERAVLYAQHPSTNDDPTAPFDPNVTNRDAMMLQALVPVVTGEVPVLFRAWRERDIRTLLLFLDKFPDVRPVLVGADQAFRVANELAQREIPVIVGSAISLTADREDPISAAWENAAILHSAGVTVAFGTNDVQQARNLPYHAARSAAYGLPKDVALRGVTLTPAEILGLGDEMGSIDVGKRADLIVTTGDPLQIVTQVERAFIGGEEVSLESKHTRLWKAFRDRH